jgi:hypothetical protein
MIAVAAIAAVSRASLGKRNVIAPSGCSGFAGRTVGWGNRDGRHISFITPAGACSPRGGKAMDDLDNDGIARKSLGDGS